MARETYFYDQKRTQRPKRYRKSPDDYSILGDRGVPIRKISVISRASSASGESVFRLPKSALKAPSSERTTLNEPHPTTPSKPKSLGGLGFPQVDSSSGRRRSSHLDPSEASWITPGKEKLLYSIEEEDKSQDRNVNFFSSFDEAKFAATGILSQLVKVFDADSVRKEGLEVELPTALIGNLRKDFEELCEDTVVEKRDWQTDCYLDWEKENRHPFFEFPPEDKDLVCSALDNSVSALINKQQQRKRVKMATEGGPEGKRGTLSARRGSATRPVSSMSIHSEALGSEFMCGEFVEEKDDGFDFLPPGLAVQTPTTPLLQYRGEFLAPNYEHMKSPTRLEKNEKLKHAAKRISVFRRKKTAKEKHQAKEEEVPDDSQKHASAASLLKQGQGWIPFAMSSAACEGWLVEPDDSHDPEGVTLLKWVQARLKAAIKQKKEDQFIAHLRGEDGPLTLRYYNDMHHRSRQSRPRVPQSYITIPLPPGVQAGVMAMRLSLPSMDPQPEDQRKKFITILPDGSGTLYYRSGRSAVVLTRKGDGSKGLLTFAFSDSAPQRMLAFFTPGGTMCCYHPSGGIHLLTDRSGGTLYDEDGLTVRQWTWPEQHYKLPVSVAVTLSDALSFRCTGLSFAFLYFASGSVNHKISVAPVRESWTATGGVDGEEAYTLKSTAAFSSNTAFSLLPCKDNNKKEKPSAHSKTALKSVDLDSSSHLENEDELSIELRSYKARVKCTVDEWMAHYRRFLGVSPRTPSPLANSRTSFVFSSGPPSRLQSSRTQPRPQSHMRHKTHPLPGSRPASQLSVLFQSPPCSPSPDPGTSNVGLVYGRPSSSRAKSHTVQYPVMITANMKGVSQGLNARKLGCPVALRTLIQTKCPALPPCRCDQRHMPTVTDTEYDRFLQTHVPKDQCVVVCVRNSRVQPQPGAGGLVGTLTTLYSRLHRNRTSPCERCAMDPYRIVCYDLSTAAQKGKEGDPPLLVSRHGIAADMVLVYWNAKLVFAGGKFNGYGVTLKDFTREMESIKRKIDKGQFLPHDFKFRPVTEADPVGVSIGSTKSLSEFSDDLLSLSASGLWASQSSITKLHGSLSATEGSLLKYTGPES